MPKIVYVEEIHLNGEVLQINGIHATRIEIVWISVHFDATKNIEICKILPKKSGKS